MWNSDDPEHGDPAQAPDVGPEAGGRRGVGGQRRIHVRLRRPHRRHGMRTAAPRPRCRITGDARRGCHAGVAWSRRIIGSGPGSLGIASTSRSRSSSWPSPRRSCRTSGRSKPAAWRSPRRCGTTGRCASTATHSASIGPNGTATPTPTRHPGSRCGPCPPTPPTAPSAASRPRSSASRATSASGSRASGAARCPPPRWRSSCDTSPAVSTLVSVTPSPWPPPWRPCSCRCRPSCSGTSSGRCSRSVAGAWPPPTGQRGPEASRRARCWARPCWSSTRCCCRPSWSGSTSCTHAATACCPGWPAPLRSPSRSPGTSGWPSAIRSSSPTPAPPSAPAPMPPA